MRAGGVFTPVEFLLAEGNEKELVEFMAKHRDEILLELSQYDDMLRVILYKVLEGK